MSILLNKSQKNYVELHMLYPLMMAHVPKKKRKLIGVYTISSYIKYHTNNATDIHVSDIHSVYSTIINIVLFL